MIDVLAIGEVLVDLVSNEPAAHSSWMFQANPGGAPANVAVGVARLGRQAGFLGALSNDFFGTWLRNVLAAEGVDLRHAPPSAKPTTLAFVSLDALGERSFSFYRTETSDPCLTPHDITDTALASTRAIHVCSVALSRDPARSAVLSAVRRAREAGVFVSFDVNLRKLLWDDLAAAERLIREVIAHSDLVKVSEEELAFLAPGQSLNQLRSKFGCDGKHTLWVATMGSHGAQYVYGDHSGEVAGLPVEAIDTTGAGDAFVAALLVQLCETGFVFSGAHEITEALRFSNAAAALSVQRHGAIPALPTREEVEAFLAHQTRNQVAAPSRLL